MARDDLVITGVGLSDAGRNLGRSLIELTIDAATAACADAGIEPSSIDGLLSEAQTFTPLMSEVQACFGLGPDTFSAQIGLFGAGAVATPLLARGALATGQATTFLCVFGIRIAPFGPGAHHAEDPYKANLEMPVGYFPQVTYMAAMTNRYFAQHEAVRELLPHVAISSRSWGALNPDAAKREKMSVEDYLRSPMVSEPLRAADCCLVSDAAAAFVMTTRERAADHRGKPVRIAGVARAAEPIAEHNYLGVRLNSTTLPSRFSGGRAMQEAGVTPRDVDAVYLYDCFSIIPVLQLEDMGFAAPGEALELFASGATAPGGSLPLNTDGGMMSNRFLPGLNMVVEAVKQLRGDAGTRQVAGAEVALVGAWSAQEHSTLVLARD